MEFIIRDSFIQEGERIQKYPLDKYHSASIGYPQRWGNFKSLYCVAAEKSKMSLEQFNSTVKKLENDNCPKFGC